VTELFLYLFGPDYRVRCLSRVYTDGNSSPIPKRGIFLVAPQAELPSLSRPNCCKMGFLRKSLYTVVGVPAALLGAEYVYTRKCKEVPPTDRLPKYSPLAARTVAENKARKDRFERIVSVSELTDRIGPVDDVTLSRRLARQIWLSWAYLPQLKLFERLEKSSKLPDANLSRQDIASGDLVPGFDVSQHLVLSDIVGSFIQFNPRVTDWKTFDGPAGIFAVDVYRRNGNVVFGIEGVSVGIPAEGKMLLSQRAFWVAHQIYSRILLEAVVRRILRGKGE
jgi:hypothetical protein